MANFVFCVDLQKLIELNLTDSYQIPAMKERTDSLEKTTIFRTLNVNSRYWQLNPSKRIRLERAIICQQDVFQCKGIPFRPSNDLSSFERLLDIILILYKWQTSLGNQDSVTIFWDIIKNHYCHMDDVLFCFKNGGATLQILKCSVFESRAKYLGHIIKLGRLKI